MRRPQPGQNAAASGMRASQSGQDTGMAAIAFILESTINESAINLALTRNQAKCSVSCKF